jgi:RNA polymerase sigma factor (sigma-70 family)
MKCPIFRVQYPKNENLKTHPAYCINFYLLLNRRFRCQYPFEPVLARLLQSTQTVEVMKALVKKTDHELIRLFTDGNLDALEILVLRHKDKLYTSILFLVKDKYLAEDIFQDVFIRIIDTMRSGRYTEEGKFLPWAMRIAHNLCVDHFRKVKRTPTIRTGEDKDIFEVLNFSEDSAETVMIRRQSHDRVRDMLQSLPEDQREVIILRHYADMSFKEIAAATNCSINTALGRMRYGLINLRKLMTQKQIAL